MPSITEARDAQYVYPQAKDAKDATLDSCASDYYSISGSCCPKYVILFCWQGKHNDIKLTHLSVAISRGPSLWEEKLPVSVP